MTTNKMQLFWLIYLFLISSTYFGRCSLSSITPPGRNIGGQYQKL